MKDLSLFAVILLLPAGCARVVAPGGGPEDRDPPVFVECFPAPGVVSRLPELLVLHFSERLEPYSVVPVMYPHCAHSLRFKGNTMEFRLFEPPSVSTFTLLVPPGLRDARGNPSPEALSLAWTTADTALTSTLTFSASMQGGGSAPTTTTVRLQTMTDTLTSIRGAYPDTSGHGRIGWLEPGDYRILAFDDRDGSRTWEDQTEPGVMKTFSVLQGVPVHLDLVMAVVDTVGPRMVEAGPLDTHHVIIQWNEELSRVPPEPGLFRITGPGGETREILGTSLIPGRASMSMILYTERLPDTLLTLFTGGVFDLMGNPSRPDSLSFWGTDTLPAQEFAVVIAFPSDGLAEVTPAGPYSITLNAWVPLDSVAARYTVTRVSDGAPVPGTMERFDAVTFNFTPEQHLSGQRQYRIDLGDGLTTLWGDTLQGQSWVFTTAWSTLPGGIEGTLTGTSREATLILAPAGSVGEPRVLAVPPGPYSITGVPGGRYTLAAFVDVNGNGVWNPGEPYGAWPGVVEVLPGLTTSEVHIAILP